MKKILVLNILLILTACGKGGTENPTPPVPIQPLPSQPTPKDELGNQNDEPTFLTDSEYYNNRTNEYGSNKSSIKFPDKIVINGITYNLPQIGDSLREHDDFIKNENMILNKPNKELTARYGVMNQKNGGIYAFYNAKQPDFIPPTGIAKYEGEGIGVEKGKQDREIFIFDVNAQVDFSTKDVTVKFEEDKSKKKFEFKGTLEQHTFNNNGLRGVLSGENSNEIVGIFSNDEYIGSFGASRD